MVWYHFPPRGTHLVKGNGTKTMLIKFEVEDSFADRMKMHYGKKRAAQAFSEAAEDALKLYEEVKRLKRHLQDRDIEIRVLRQTLDGARSAAVHLLEACGQGDMFNDSVPLPPPSSSRPATPIDKYGTVKAEGPRPNESLEDYMYRLKTARIAAGL